MGTMMLEVLDRLDARIAAGILAKATLRLNHQWQTSPNEYPIEAQSEIEIRILEELRRSLDLAPDDFSERAIELLTEALDSYSERLILSVDGEVSINNLNAKGLVPSDMLELDFPDSFYSTFDVGADAEKHIAELTVKRPHREEHVLSVEDQSKEVASLYSRYFRHQYPAREFWLLVIVQPIGARSNIHDVWRLYPADLDLSRCESLVDALSVFSETFGLPVHIGGIKGSFFLTVRRSALNGIAQQVTAIRQTSANHYKHQLRLGMFARVSSGSELVQLLTVIDVTNYKHSVAKRHGWDKDIVSQLTREDSDVSGFGSESKQLMNLDDL